MKFLCFFLSLLTLQFGSSLPREKRVIGQVTDVVADCAHIALVSNQDTLFHCGAAIIGEKHLLTTQLCAEGDEIFTSIGTIKEIYSHPQYDSSTLTNNIAIIELKESLQFNDTLKKACFASTPHLPAQFSATFCGYGIADDNQRGKLNHAEFNKISMDECKQTAPTLPSDDNFCTRTPGYGFCAGDQGSPLIWTDQNDVAFVVGLASWTTCEKGETEVFVNVTHFYDWISNHVPQSELCNNLT